MKSGSMTLHGGHVADVKKASTPRWVLIRFSKAERFEMVCTGLVVAGDADKAADATLFSIDMDDGVCWADCGGKGDGWRACVEGPNMLSIIGLID